MPAKTEKQRRAAGLALAVKRGKVPKNRVGGSAKKMASSMKTGELRKTAKKRKSRKKT